MKRLMLALVPLALLFSACAVGAPKPPTYVSDTGVTLNADIYSNFGDTDFWWVYGETTDYGTETAHRTVQIPEDELNDPHPVSQPIAGLAAATTYHYQLCVQDHQEDPGRIVCTKDQTFTTGAAGGRSGIAFMSSRDDGNLEVYAMGSDGSDQTRLTTTGATEDAPTWSPDGRKLAFHSFSDNNFDIFVMDADGTDPVNLTQSPSSYESGPAWSPDGTRIAFVSNRDGAGGGLWVMGADGGSPTKLAANVVGETPAWSPDGAKIAYTAFRSLNHEILVIDASGGEPTNITPSNSYEEQPAWSPDGTRIAYRFMTDAQDSLSSVIHVMNADGTNRVNLTPDMLSNRYPTWSPDGSQIAFRGLSSDGSGIHVMNSDGSNQVAITVNADSNPAWSPRP